MKSLLLKSLHLLLLDCKELLQLFKMVHENSSSFEGSFLNHNLGLGEQLEEVFEDFLGHTEESGSILLGRLLEVVLFASNLDDKVRSEIEHQLVLTEERILRELDKRSHTLLIVENGRTLRDEIHF